jgi:hypothetical protein
MEDIFRSRRFQFPEPGKISLSPSVPLHMRPCEQCRIMVRRTIALLDISNLPFSMFIITKPSPSHPGGLCSQRLVGRLSTVSVVILHTCAFSNHTGLSSSSQLGPSSFLLLSRRLPCKMILLRKSRIMFCGSIAWPCSLSWLAPRLWAVRSFCPIAQPMSMQSKHLNRNFIPRFTEQLPICCDLCGSTN